MNKLKLALPQNRTTKARNGLNITVVLLIVLVMFDVYSTNNFLTLRTTTQLFAMGLSYVMSAIALAGAWLSWNNRAETAGWLLIAGSLAALFFSNFLGTGLAVIYALTSIVVVFAIANSTLPRERLGQAMIISALSGVAGILVDIYFPNEVAAEAVPQTFTYVMLLVLMVLLIFVALRQAWSGNIRIKIITAFLLMALTSLSILGGVTYFSYRNQVREDFRQRLINIASITASQTDGDLHARIKSTQDMAAEPYQKLLAQGQDIIATDPDLKYIYTMRMNDQGQIYFVIDARQASDPEIVDVGVVYEEPSQLLVSNFNSLNSPIAESEIYTDEYGSVLSAYTPIYRTDGTLEAILGVDISADKVIAAEQAGLRLILITTAIAMALVTILGFFLGNIFTKPIINLSNTARKITEGDLNARAEVETMDEVGNLAINLNAMTSQLQETLQGLEQRVADRTRNLELAAEVGRSVSQVRSLDIMLKDACELILQEFNLYYVQVYLTDPSASTLKLEAGTGNVGAQLLERNHSLPLDTSSINGRAATERRSVLISDTAQSAVFRQNPLLSNTRSELAVPLILGDKVVGVLDMQSGESGELNEEVLPAFEALAGQLAIAVQNANLLAETEQARAQVEAQARRLVREGWSEHLDAIHKPEQIGFMFNHNTVTPLADVDASIFPETGNAISASISVTGETLGSLVVEIKDESRREQTNELTNIVARQVAQQIENLRLLESAERFRAEAEQASRRLTRESWKSYADNAGASLNYIYDLNEVRPFKDETLKESATVPLKVRDQKIGNLSIQGLTSEDSEGVEIAHVVAERLSAHIESLRQYDQTQSALAQSEKLFKASRRLTQSESLDDLVLSAVEALDIHDLDRVIMGGLEYTAAGDLTGMSIIANWSQHDDLPATPVGTHYPKEILSSISLFTSTQPVFVNDMWQDERIDETTKALAKRVNYRAVAALPLYTGSRQDGILIFQSAQPHSFTPEETRLFTSLAPQLATVLENRRQFERAQQQAQRESALNVINQKIQSATTVEAVLQIAARELGHALGAPMTIAQLSLKDNDSSS